MKIAFIGLGNMGAPMARNLIAAGHDLVGSDPAAPEGFALAPASEAAAGADAVVTMLPSGPILRAVYDQVVPAATNALFLDCSTADVASARAAAQIAEAAGHRAVDAPVSGGVGGAEAGTLTFMAGGSDAAFAEARPLFDIMGARAIHCGQAGAGQAAKICNNMLLGISMIGTCEAFALADRLGLSRQAFYDVASTSSGQCWSLTTYSPAPGIGPEAPSDRDYRPGFAATLMLKDLGLAMEAAGDARPELGALAHDIYARFVAQDEEARDFSAILPWLTG